MAFRPGVSGNPSGRPKGSGGLASTVRRQVGGDPRQLIEALRLIATGDCNEVERQFGVRPGLGDRVSAISELLKRGWAERSAERGTVS